MIVREQVTYVRTLACAAGSKSESMRSARWRCGSCPVVFGGGEAVPGFEAELCDAAGDGGDAGVAAGVGADAHGDVAWRVILRDGAGDVAAGDDELSRHFG